MRHRTVALIVVLATAHLAILLAGFVAPYDPAAQNREFAYARPARIHFFGASGFHLRPFVYALTPEFDSPHEDHSREYPLQFFVRGDRYKILGVMPSSIHLFGVEGPGRIFLFGTDSYGRDEFSRLLYGGQISLAAGLLATFITLAVAA